MASTMNMQNNEKPFGNLEKLDLSAGEIQKLTDAFKNEEFRKLFADYAEEISNPENKKKYEEEIAQMENERGMDVKFIHPEPCYVLKCNDGAEKIFINICKNKELDKPSASKKQDPKGNFGLMWSVPHSFAPPREDLDSSNVKCKIIDIVFNPDVIRMAESNASFKKMCEDIAVEGVQKQFGIKLDPKNIKRPKMKYKGTPQATVIRSRSAVGAATTDDTPKPNDDLFPYPYDDLTTAEKSAKHEKKIESKVDGKPEDDMPAAMTPKYSIVHRSGIEMHEFCNEPHSKRDIRPKELLINIELPLLSSAAGVDLDIFEKQLVLEVESPAWYKLDLKLPYAVDENRGTAKFDKSKKRLVVTLPVVLLPNKSQPLSKPVEEEKPETPAAGDAPTPAPLIEVLSSREDVSLPASESDNQLKGLVANGNAVEEKMTESREEPNASSSKDIWDSADVSTEPVIRYSLPNYDCNQDLQTVSFVLHVNNVKSESVTKTFDTEHRSITIKFVSIGSGYVPVYYSLCARFPESCEIAPDQCSVDVSDENVAVLLLKEKSCRMVWNTYEIGLNPDELEEKLFLTDESLNKSLDELEADAKQHSESSTKVKLPNLHVTKMNEKNLTFHVGSPSDDELGDEPDSPKKSPDIQVIHEKKCPSLHGILKPRSVSMSESSDDATAQQENKYVRSQSMPSSYSSDSPRTGNESDECSIRKSVSFNEHIDTTRFKPSAAVNTMKATLKSKRRRMRKREARVSGRQRRHSSSEYSSDDHLDHHDDNNTQQQYLSDPEKDEAFIPDEQTIDKNGCSFDTIHEASPVPMKGVVEVGKVTGLVDTDSCTLKIEENTVDTSMLEADENSVLEDVGNGTNSKKSNKKSKSKQKRKKTAGNSNNTVINAAEKPLEKSCEEDDDDSDDKANDEEVVDLAAVDKKEDEFKVETMLSWDEPPVEQRSNCPIEFSNTVMFELDSD